MKNLIALLPIALLAVSACAAPLDYWTFDNDAEGSAFGSNWENSGILGSTWNYGGPSTMSADGAGHLVVSNHAGLTYRKLNPYNPPFTSGVYRLEFDLASWGLDTNALGSTLTFGAMSDASPGGASTFIAAIRVRIQDASTARLQMFGHFDGLISNYRNFDFSLADVSGITLAIEFDFDADTATYFTNGVVAHSFIGFTGSQIETLQFNSNGSWSSNSVVVIDGMGLLGPDTVQPLLAVDFRGSMITSAVYIGEANFLLDTNAPTLGTNNYTGQPFYTGSEEVDITGTPISSAAALTFQNNGIKLQWNSSDPSTGEYATGDKFTGVFLFMKEDFLNGLDSGQIIMVETNDTLKAVVDFDPKVPPRLSEANFRWLVKDSGQYYISSPTTFTISTGSLVLSADALDLSWFEYYPETVSVSVVSNAASPTLQNIEGLGFQMDATVATNTGVRTYCNITVSSFSAEAFKNTATPTSLWDYWVLGYPGLGANTNYLDHADSDSLANLTEYAWGGDPTDGNNRGNAPLLSQGNVGGTNYLEYIYYERDDAAIRGLSSILEVGADLTLLGWEDGSAYEIGRGASGEIGFIAVTNRIPTDAENQQFIRLQIEFTP